MFNPGPKELPKLDADAPIIGTKALCLGDFWSWAYSDVLSNANRGRLAEFLVAAALGDAANARMEWDAYDAQLGGTKVEVKSSAFVQNWPQEKPTAPSFSIGPKLFWDARANQLANMPSRPADVYVFALLAATNPVVANPLDINQWLFYVVATAKLEASLKHVGQKTISLGRIERLAKPAPWSLIRQRILDEAGLAAGRRTAPSS